MMGARSGVEAVHHTTAGPPQHPVPHTFACAQTITARQARQPAGYGGRASATPESFDYPVMLNPSALSGPQGQAPRRGAKHLVEGCPKPARPFVPTPSGLEGDNRKTLRATPFGLTPRQLCMIQFTYTLRAPGFSDVAMTGRPPGRTISRGGGRLTRRGTIWPASACIVRGAGEDSGRRR
jgi:hypothetical protein